MQATIKYIYTRPRKVCQKVPATSWTNALCWALDLHQLNPQSNTTEHTVASSSSSYPCQCRSNVGSGLVVWRSLGTSRIQSVLCSTAVFKPSTEATTSNGVWGEAPLISTILHVSISGSTLIEKVSESLEAHELGTQVRFLEPGLGWIQSSKPEFQSLLFRKQNF